MSPTSVDAVSHQPHMRTRTNLPPMGHNQHPPEHQQSAHGHEHHFCHNMHHLEDAAYKKLNYLDLTFKCRQM